MLGSFMVSAARPPFLGLIPATAPRPASRAKTRTAAHAIPLQHHAWRKTRSTHGLCTAFATPAANNHRMVMIRAAAMVASGTAVLPGPAGVRIGTVQTARAVRYPTVRSPRGTGTAATRGARTDVRLVARPRRPERVRRVGASWGGTRSPDIGSPAVAAG